MGKGSSPRVWGQVTRERRGTQTIGIIPTRVGTRGRNLSEQLAAWDHPHACGDKRGFLRFPRYTLGSSPRVWGQVSILICSLLKIRIIPTRVGTSLIPPALWACC